MHSLKWCAIIISGGRQIWTKTNLHLQRQHWPLRPYSHFLSQALKYWRRYTAENPEWIFLILRHTQLQIWMSVAWYSFWQIWFFCPLLFCFIIRAASAENEIAEKKLSTGIFFLVWRRLLHYWLYPWHIDLALAAVCAWMREWWGIVSIYVCGRMLRKFFNKYSK